MDSTALAEWHAKEFPLLAGAALAFASSMLSRIQHLEAETESMRVRIPYYQSLIAAFEKAKQPQRDEQARLNSEISHLRSRRATESAILAVCIKWNAIENELHKQYLNESEQRDTLEGLLADVSVNESRLWNMRRNLVIRSRMLTEKAERRARRAAKRREAGRRKAILAAAEGNARSLAQRVRSSLKQQAECPYCGGLLGDNPHADHIYPVSKGGLSVIENLVFVCAQCNGRKSTMTLAQFIRTYSLDRNVVEQRLRILGKDF